MMNNIEYFLYIYIICTFFIFIESFYHFIDLIFFIFCPLVPFSSKTPTVVVVCLFFTM